MERTCSRPPAEVLKIRTCSDSITYTPRQASPSPKTSSPSPNFFCTMRSASEANSDSVKPEKTPTFCKIERVALGLGAGIPVIVRYARRTFTSRRNTDDPECMALAGQVCRLDQEHDNKQRPENQCLSQLGEAEFVNVGGLGAADEPSETAEQRRHERQDCELGEDPHSSEDADCQQQGDLAAKESVALADRGGRVREAASADAHLDKMHLIAREQPVAAP